MKKLLILFFLLITPVYAGEVEILGLGKITYDDDVSFKNYSGLTFLNSDIDFSGKTIYASSFASEIPHTKVFPDMMVGATFILCDMKNIDIPEGNFLVMTDTRSYQVQSDGADWWLDDNGNPTTKVCE